MIEFQRGHRRGRGILLDVPVRGVVGIVECATPGCGWRMVLTVEEEHQDPDKMAEAVDEFMTTHQCGRAPGVAS